MAYAMVEPDATFSSSFFPVTAFLPLSAYRKSWVANPL